MLKIREVRAALLAERTGCGELCSRFHAARMLENIELMQDGEPPEMTEEEVRELRDGSISTFCKDGCVWIQRTRDTAFRYLDVRAKWRVDRKPEPSA